jgi:hypothetical protein
VDIVTAHPAKEPLFLYVPFNAVHNTLSVPEGFGDTQVFAAITKDITFSTRKLFAGAAYVADQEVKNLNENMFGGVNIEKRHSTLRFFANSSSLTSFFYLRKLLTPINFLFVSPFPLVSISGADEAGGCSPQAQGNVRQHGDCHGQRQRRVSR